MRPHQAQIDLLCTIPGINTLTAYVLIAELGLDMSVWPSHRHLAAWSGVAPGCRETGGKARKAPARKGNPFVCSALVEAAGAAVKKRDCHLAGKYRHLCARTGSKMKARVAIAHKLLVIVYHVLSTQQPYQEPKPSGPNALSRQKRIQRHLRELRVLGLEVLVSPISAQP